MDECDAARRGQLVRRAYVPKPRAGDTTSAHGTPYMRQLLMAASPTCCARLSVILLVESEARALLLCLVVKGPDENVPTFRTLGALMAPYRLAMRPPLYQS